MGRKFLQSEFVLANLNKTILARYNSTSTYKFRFWMKRRILFWFFDSVYFLWLCIQFSVKLFLRWWVVYGNKLGAFFENFLFFFIIWIKRKKKKKRKTRKLKKQQFSTTFILFLTVVGNINIIETSSSNICICIFMTWRKFQKSFDSFGF